MVRLDHPNVLPLFGFFFEDLNEFPTLVSEFAKNGTMIAYMQSRPFDARGICEIVSLFLPDDPLRSRIVS